MKYFREKIAFRTTTQTDFVDITADVSDVIDKSDIRKGQVCVFVQHTTMGVVINHNEPMLLQDFMRVLERVAPSDEQYAHDLFELKKGRKTDGRSNGNAHCKALFTGTEVTVPIENGHMMLSDIQSIFAVDFDGARDRDVIISVSGI